MLLVVALLIARFIFVREYDGDVVFNLFMGYAVPTWIAVIGANFYEGRRLSNYLNRHHREKWEYLTSGPGFGPGGYNSFRSLPFLFSKDDLNDPHVRSLKGHCRSFLKLVLIIFFSMPIVFLITVLDY